MDRTFLQALLGWYIASELTEGFGLYMKATINQVDTHFMILFVNTTSKTPLEKRQYFKVKLRKRPMSMNIFFLYSKWALSKYVQSL